MSFAFVAFWGIRLLGPRGFLVSILMFLIVPIVGRAIFCRGWEVEQVRGVVLWRLDSIVYGVLVAYVSQGALGLLARWKKSFMVLGVVLASAAVSWFYSGDNTMLRNVWVFPLMSIGVALMLPGFVCLPSFGALLEPCVRYISRVSYSVYLLHMPLFFVLEPLLQPLYLNSIIKLLVRLVMVGLALALSNVTYVLVEKRFMRLRAGFNER